MQHSNRNGVERTVVIEGDLREAILLYSPHCANMTTGTVLSNNESRVIRVGENIAVKFGEEVVPEEAEALKFVKSSTSIPVPEVFGVLKRGKVCYIVLEYIAGRTLTDIWPTLSVESKNNISKKLKGCFEDLNGISGKYIGGIGFKGSLDPLFDEVEKGPFESEEAMRKQIGAALEKVDYPNFARFAPMMLSTGNSIVFCHGDISPDNIKVSDDQILAVIGWKYAGFYPEQWEFSNAMWNCLEVLRGSDWVDYVPTIVKPDYIHYAKMFTIREALL